MRCFADASEDRTVLEDCNRLADSYLAWIDEKSTEIETGHSFPAGTSSCGRTAHRVMSRLSPPHRQMALMFLRHESDARLAFACMNRAMLEQQLHYDLAANHRREWETVWRIASEGTVCRSGIRAICCRQGPLAAISARVHPDEHSRHRLRR